MKVGGDILEPYSQTPLEIALRNVTCSPAHATTTKQSWSCTHKGLDKTQTCDCSTPIKNIPPNLLTSNDSGVVAEVTYGYKSLIFDYFMKRAAGAATSGTGVYTLTETIYLKPRSQAAICSRTTPLARCRRSEAGGEGTRAACPPPGVPYLRRERRSRRDGPSGLGQSPVVFAQRGHFHLCWSTRRAASAEAWQG
jgi:hypothetical protein